MSPPRSGAAAPPDGGGREAIVIVGAGRGVGAAVARRFGHAGHPIGLVARDPGRLRALGDELTAEGLVVAVAPADATDPAALTRAVDELGRGLGPVGTLLFSPLPDVGRIKPVLDTTPEDVAAALSLNVTAAATAVAAVVGPMRERGRGTLLFTTGGAALEPHHDRAVSGIAYAAESAYVRMLHDALAADGVHVSQLTIVGAVGSGDGARHDPATVADQLHRQHAERRDPLVVLR